LLRPAPSPPLFPYTTLFRSLRRSLQLRPHLRPRGRHVADQIPPGLERRAQDSPRAAGAELTRVRFRRAPVAARLVMETTMYDHIDRKSTRLNSSHVEISYAV